MPSNDLFDWIPIFKELAEKILPYATKRSELASIISSAYQSSGIEMFTMTAAGQPFNDVDPFTFFATFNRKTADSKRKALLMYYKTFFGLESKMPTAFNSIPIADSRNSCFYPFGKGQKDAIDNLWNLYRLALGKSKGEDVNEEEITKRFKDCIYIKTVGTAKLTMGLYWIAPDYFINLDSRNRWYIYEAGKLPADFVAKLPPQKVIRDKIKYRDYETIRMAFAESFKDSSFPFDSLSDLSQEAWRYSNEVNEQIAKEKQLANIVTSDDISPEIKPHKQPMLFEYRRITDFKEYSESDFLSDVFVDAAFYKKVSTILQIKKNLILQGPPGVGKTYMAKRLCYALMGEKDDGRIGMVQFHQSYSYEDFVQGYKPTQDGGFSLMDGIFYSFCKQANRQPEKSFYFIIDEINRGNISKIFGELLMLIENTHRGEKDALPLAYKSNEKFFVPDNVFLIGMMNTADRSLALLDYALRRRFAFVTMEPAFEKDNPAFAKLIEDSKATKLKPFISEIKSLNAVIAKDPSLGKGFKIGHSYFTDPNLDDERLASIAQFEIIPVLEEYFVDDEKKLEEWTSRLRKVFE